MESTHINERYTSASANSPKSNQSKLMPMSPLAASATVINLVLATGPFSYPSQFASLGPVFSLIFLFMTAIISYITSTFLIEAISYGCAQKQGQLRYDTLFPMETYNSPIMQTKFNKKDTEYKNSPYYIRVKIELGKLAEAFCAQWIKVLLMIVLVIYMYGAMCLKYASGSESFVQAVSFTIFHDANEWARRWPNFDPYYLGIIIFGSLSLLFSFGNIENSKMLQIVTGAMRFVVIMFMYGGTIYYLITNGVHHSPVFDFAEQASHVANAFGGTVFVFIFHHSISGIVYSIRPQSNVKPMFLYSHIIGSSLLAIEGFLAWLAFSGLPNKCTTNVFPCQIADLFNENFVNLPFIGQVCNFYPMLNVSSVPVLTITLRNNLMEVIPIKKWLAGSDNKVCQFLLQDDRRIVKGVWSIIISIPVIIIVIFEKNPQEFITYTGGICGTFILFFIPLTLVWHARKKNLEATYGENFNKSQFKHPAYLIIVLVYAVLTLSAVIAGLIIKGSHGGH